MAQFPSVKARRMLAILKRGPLHYTVVSQAGSHRKLQSARGYPDLRFSFHDKYSLSPNDVREILVDGVGLTEQEAQKLI